MVVQKFDQGTYVVLIFPNNAFETAEFWCIVGLTAILHLLQN